MQAKADPVGPFDPYGSETPEHALYVGPALQQRLDLIEHLLEFGRQLILLSGDAGAGKTSVLAAIAQSTRERWRCIALHGGPTLDGTSLLAQVADALGQEAGREEYPEGDPDLLSKVRHRIGLLERGGKPVVLLLDDADRLPPDALGMLLALARTEDQSAEARVLMTAAREHSGLIASLQRDRQQHGLVHVVELPGIAEEETEDFLRQRLGPDRGALEDWFSSATLVELAQEAQGNPGALVALARQASLGVSPMPSKSATAGPLTRLKSVLGVGRPRWRWAPAALLPVALIGWLVLRPGAPEPPALLPEQTRPAPALAPAAPVPELAVPSMAASTSTGGTTQRIEIALPPVPPSGTADAAAPVPDPAAAAQVGAPPTLDLSVAPALTAAAVAAVAATDTSARADVVKQTLPSAAEAPEPAAPPPAAKPEKNVGTTAKTSQPSAPKPAATPAKPAPKPSVKPGAVTATAKPNNGYALQLFGVTERKAATAFIARHKLGERARIIDSRRDGKPWFVLVYGAYPTRSAAQNAAALLPPAVRREVQPWVRDVKSLNALPR